jgi:hypothetical protein
MLIKSLVWWLKRLFGKKKILKMEITLDVKDAQTSNVVSTLKKRRFQGIKHFPWVVEFNSDTRITAYLRNVVLEDDEESELEFYNNVESWKMVCVTWIIADLIVLYEVKATTTYTWFCF